MRAILIYLPRLACLSLLIGLASPLASQVTDSLSVARRVAAAATLAAQEYALGVVPEGGRIRLPEEVGEARLFIDQARLDVGYLPAGVRGSADSSLARMAELLDRLAPPTEVEALASGLVGRLAAAVGGALEVLPTRPPSLERGSVVYREQCAACHGDAGRGDGPKAATLEGPPPADLTDATLMAGTSPVDVFRRVTIGVPGTAMPEFEETLSREDRWAVTAYVMTLSGGSGLVHARQGASPGEVFAAVRRQVDSAVALRSERLAFDAYLTFERIETEVRAKAPGLAGELEAAFGWLRGRVASADAAERRAIAARLLAGLERAERVVADRGSGGTLFAQSLVLMLREGFEAILIIGALMAFLARAGASERRREVAMGAWAAVAASIATWGLVELLFHVTPAHREAIEGFTMLLAMAVLFYVSYWLLSKIEVTRWTAFVRGKVEAAISTGSGLALAAVAFLAVYREGFETILFYQALLGSAGGQGAGLIAAGAGAGAILLVGVYVAVNYFGLRLPLRPFFAVTSAVLYYMAFVFAGKGVAELQAAGHVKLTPLAGAPRFPLLGIYPTLESLALQGVLLVLAGGALAWLFLKSAAARQAVVADRPPAVSDRSSSPAPSPAGES
ncbi:MAG TPA: cytochrome c/FTR1 family iron permease [Gemmatimonadales bacterium]|nr:cytochrome c/FTR1 family iron permease [Gemmatimonadales bacterium]